MHTTFLWYYQFKKFDLNKIKVDEKLYKIILIYYRCEKLKN